MLMRKAVLAAAIAAVAVPAAPVLADPPPHAKAHGRRAKERAADWRAYRNYDYNRVDPRYGGYYADRYYRDGGYYEPRVLGYNDRIYRGQDGRYYCRRSDGTTGLIIGALGGGVLGNVIAPGGSKTLGSVVGAGVGALIGREIDRGGVRCR